MLSLHILNFLTRKCPKNCLWLAFVVICLLFSCSEERPILDPQGDMASISLFFPTSRGFGNPEKTLDSLRVIIFRSTELGVELGAPVTNRIVYPIPPDDDEIEVTEIVPVGYLNIYLIGNESVDMHLETVTSFNDLRAVVINNDLPLHDYLSPSFPMYSGYRAVRVDALGNITHPNVSTAGGKYTFLVERAISRLDVKLSCVFADLGGRPITIDSASIKSMPLKPWLVPAEYTLTADTDFFSTDYRSSSKDVSTYLTTTRVDGLPGFENFNNVPFTFYIPEHIFSNTSQSRNHFTYLKLVGHQLPPYSPTTLTYRIPIADSLGIGSNTVAYLLNNYATVPVNDLQISRNMAYDLVLNIKGLGERDDIEVSAVVKDWDLKNREEDLFAPFLNISTVSTVVNGFTSQRIYFWTNLSASEIELEPTGYTGTTSGTPFNVNNVYTTVAGSPHPVNFHFDAGAGTGYFDLIVNPSLPTTPPTRYLIYLTAGKLRREVEVYTSYLAPAAAWSTTPWAGTFHRATEVGERFIYSGHSGSWRAEVENSTGVGSFIKLGNGEEVGAAEGLQIWERYMDMMLTNTPGNPELTTNHVQGNLKEVSGMGNIAFRVGMAAPFTPSFTTPARYGRIKVTWDNGGTPATSYIYVRQGEDPDFVMRPEDFGSGGESWGTTEPRPDALRFSPYNLTYKPFTADGWVQVPYNGGMLTDYPTQAGAFFQWANATTVRYAWVPYGTVSGWNSNVVTDYWSTASATHETCPPGYRRPTDGMTSGDNGVASPSNSEMRQSLFLDPPTYTASSSGNSITGFYADGFFDRRPIVSNSTVAAETNDVAHVGRLFYNPTTLASLFFSWSGMRITAGTFGGDGTQGLYYTGSKWAADRSWYLVSIGSNAYFTMTATTPNGASIRCGEDPLKVSPSSLFFYGNNYSVPEVVTVTSYRPGWTTGVTYHQGSDWLSITPVYGSDNTFTVVPASPNTGAVDRTATITVVSGSVYKTISVTQYRVIIM